MYINGKFTSCHASEAIQIINPATEEILGEARRGTQADVNAAVSAAQAAFPDWKRTPANERAAALHQIAAKLRAHHDELVRLLTQEEGKPIPENDEEMWWVEETFDYYAELARHERGRVVPPGDPGQFNFVIKEPYGVVGCITPWNYPLLLLAWKIAPALAAGNTVVVKPSELTPLSTLKLVEVACDHLPAGAVNVVTGYGPEAGEPLVIHPDVPVIAFTGSLAVGQRIASLAGPMIKKLHLELGGKDPMVIAPDAEMDMAVSGLAYAALLNAGQVCTSTERIYVHESIFSQFSEALADFVGKLRLGNGLDEGTDIGPMIRDKFRGKVEAQVSEALAAGAKILTGGGYTGLSVARTLATSGASVAVLEREAIGWGASSRNGGITGCGLKRGVKAIMARYGEKYGHIFWEESLKALDLVRHFAEDEGVDCDWLPRGELCVAYKPSHFESFKEDIAWNKANLGHDLHLIPPSELHNEIGSYAFYGGLLDDHGAGLHPAKLVYGVARLAAKAGAQLCERTCVTRLEKQNGGFAVHTDRGRLEAKEVLVATNGYTGRLARGVKPGVITVGSYCILTEPLSDDLQVEISPKGRMFWDSKWFLNYFRLRPDGRLLWGGRNSLTPDQDLRESADILQKQMIRAFPQLRDVPITHSWTGKLGLTFDLMPHIGRADGIHYALGYCGHGLHTALYLGQEVGLMLSGQKTSSPFAEIPHQKHFFYRDRAWFLPAAVTYYRIRDWIL